ncbi:dedicator of cytokinesis protein 7-like isoform X8 [Homarus americanus]|uniref:dedicator of cytokinesis protein 7-like isoform X8 n=1 Tax=Homarus americanus TaxID=6706 RepID=UPI001C45CDFC|nr:dedicator of cytokinesis protein 7-like isoform X8 [Homarus americanus]
MASGQRAFAQKLSKQHAADVRRTVSSVTTGKDPPRSASVSTLSTHDTLQENVDPIDYEDFLDQHQLEADRDPVRKILYFPPDDIVVTLIPRQIRTLQPVIPEEGDGYDAHVADCVRCYTRDWLYVSRQYLQYSTSVPGRSQLTPDHLANLQSCPQPEFEVDLEDDPRHSDADRHDVGGSRHSSHLSDTPRGSWASSVFDLRNSVADPLLPSLLSRVPLDTVDNNNQQARLENRQDSMFVLYPPQDEEDMIERRLYPDVPMPHSGHRIQVKCINLRLELEIEPIFATMALYDLRDKKKISENFCFDMNPEPLKRMLTSHIPYQDISTLSRTCIFDITYPSSDLFLVVRLEKVLQGDISDVVGPYMKDDANREKLKSAAVACCERLGKYRMPLAWTAINLMNIFTGVHGDRENAPEREPSGSNSLDRKQSSSSYDELKRKGGSGSLTRRGSLERRSFSEKRRSWSPEEFGACLDSFRPVTLTVSSFFKQEGDKLRDDDLYKFLADLKRPSNQLKKKCLPGLLKLDISPVRDQPKYCLTPELDKLHPYPAEETEEEEDKEYEKCRPIKEVVEFPPRDIFVPHYFYRNLLFVSPRDLNFNNRPGSARNIAVKIQFMAGEEEQAAMSVIFGKSSCPEYTTEVHTAVTYHNKSPDFYDEFKIKLPPVLGDQHHILFTFYHISCQKKNEEKTIETPVGYTWIPVYRDGRLKTGYHSLPVMMERPPSNYPYITADIQLPGTKWVDNHKGLFTVSVEAVSSVHAQDKHIDRFFHLCKMVEEGNIPARIGEANMEGELKRAMGELMNCYPEPLVRFVPVLLDRLLTLMVWPPTLAGQLVNIAQACFETVGALVGRVSALLEEKNDQHGRNSTLLAYVAYQATLPHPDDGPSTPVATSLSHHPHPPSSVPTHRKCSRSSSNPDLGIDADAEVGGIFARGLDRTNSMRTDNGEELLDIKGSNYENLITLQRPAGRKLTHEEVALQWVVSNGTGREKALANSWFFFELMIKSMTEHLARSSGQDTLRKMRFSHQFSDDVQNLAASITNDIIALHNKDVKDTRFVQNVNSSLAFFLADLLSVMDRGFVFMLMQNYCKQMSNKIMSLPDAAALINLKLDFVRIVCSHEHYVALNLPFCTPLSAISAPSSPCPSIGSTTSQSSFISTVFGGNRSAFMMLSSSFRKQHFLVGLVLSDLATALEINNPTIHGRAVNTVRNLLTSHDTDDRYTEPEVKARVVGLYLPLISIVIDALPQLHTFASSKYRFLTSSLGDDSEGGPTHIHQNVALAIAGSTMFANKESDYDVIQGTTEEEMENQQPRKCPLSSETTRNLLICLLWILRNADEITLRHTLSELPYTRLHQLLDVLYIAVSCFEYKGCGYCVIGEGVGKVVSTAMFPQLISATDHNHHNHHQAVSRTASEDTISLSLNDGRPPLPPISQTQDHNTLVQGKKISHRGGPVTTRSKEAMKSRLEEAIMGQNSARSEMMLRRRGNAPPNTPHVVGLSQFYIQGADRNPPSPSGTGEKLRWRKESFPWRHHQQDTDRSPQHELEQESQVEGHLAAEANMVILDTLENIVQVVTLADHLQGLLPVVFRVLLHGLASHQSTTTLTNMFNTQRALVAKFPGLLFDEETEQCADLCLQLLKHCSSCICTIRSHAAASLYLLMRHNFEIGNNFARVKMQVTMSLSSLVGTSQTFNEAYLRRSLKTILTYAEEDADLQDTSFPEQVRDLVFNLHMILSDTVKMKEYQEDPEMLLDLMYRIARGYQNSPDLRLTWLANMAQKHSERAQHAEAAMCLIHSAALVSEYLYMLEDCPHLPTGAVSFCKLSPNVLEESAVSDDVLSPDEEGICTGKYFTENGLVGLLEQASSSLHQAGMFECLNEVYKILTPVAEKNRDWKKLINIYSKLQDAFTKIDALEGRRIFGTYFRVGFYGSKFGDLDGEEYIYKEPMLTKLPEISHRLESFYSDRFGPENTAIIKDSNTVDITKLCSDKACIQITYVEPHFDEYEFRDRVTSFEKNYNIKRFIFSTPFTPDGRAHGELHEQYKRKTILTTQHMFPYVKTRIQVVDRMSWVLTPIEVAIEDIQKRTRELAAAIYQDPPDHKILQMVVQGCIGTTVNQGPMEVAHIFLSDLLESRKSPSRLQNKLRLCFKDFSKKCHDALRRNKTLIGPDMREYHRELERNYNRFTEGLAPMITVNHPTRSSSTISSTPRLRVPVGDCRQGSP